MYEGMYRVREKYFKFLMAATALVILSYVACNSRNEKITGTDLGDYIGLQKYNATTCKPVHHVFYLKTFKTASSTITSIMHRYALQNGLKAAITKKILFSETILKENILSLDDLHSSRPYDILAEHIRYSKNSVNKILHNDAIYIASLRHPTDQMKSYFNEFNIGETLDIHSSDPFKTYIENFDDFTEKMEKNKTSTTLAGLPAVNAFQFGLSPKDMADTAAIIKMVTMVDRDFGLVMITEYLNESLLLLKRTLCWDLKDIIYQSLRKGLYKSKSQLYGSKIRHRFEILTSADYRLYHHFVDKLLKTLSYQDQNFWEELWIFGKLLTKVDEFCKGIRMNLSESASSIFNLTGDLETGQGRKVINLDPSPFSQPFQVDAVQCAMMSLRTVISSNIVAVIQMPQLCTLPNRHNSPLTKKISIQSQDEVYINELYCTKRSKFYNIPLKVLAQNKVYMWSVSGVQSSEDE